MNFTYKIINYIIIIIIGTILIKWYKREKGWENSSGTSFLFIFSWKTIILFISIGIDLLIDYFLLELFLNVYELNYIYPIIMVLV